MLPSDRLLCAFVKPLPVDEAFKVWPLHVTIVPWFRLATSSNQLASELREKLAPIKPFEIKVGAQAKFGQRIVNLVKQPTPLSTIEQEARDTLKMHDAWLLDETTKRKWEYKPHVTEQQDARLRDGDHFLCDRIYIVEQAGGHKIVASEVPLGE
jgi:hypothetical protein